MHTVIRETETIPSPRTGSVKTVNTVMEKTKKKPGFVPRGFSRPDCLECQSLRKELRSSYESPLEAFTWNSWVTHMNAAHKNWRTGPLFDQV